MYLKLRLREQRANHRRSKECVSQRSAFGEQSTQIERISEGFRLLFCVLKHR